MGRMNRYSERTPRCAPSPKQLWRVGDFRRGLRAKSRRYTILTVNIARGKPRGGFNLFGKSAVWVVGLSVFLAVFPLQFPRGAFAADSVCARVKIEIPQELALERQAFDAHMRINNGLSHITLEDVDVEVRCFDESGGGVPASSDPGDSDALFFIRLDSLEDIDNVEGSGSVQPASTADIHWLLIPAPGASNGLERGTMYYVGATLTYTIGGEEHVTEVDPDYILVKPMPELVLDYFLPNDVYGDDAFTTQIEPAVPFSLGMRVRNNGAGATRGLKIDSAQPKIVEDEQGLLIGFAVEGCEVNGRPAAPSLLANFGDIEPNGSGVARWIMTCSLSGRFVEFAAQCSHDDELGGELTSLVEAARTHLLVRDVLVDLPGRDDVRDFLARDGGLFTVFESDGIDASVLNQSSYSSLQLQGQSDSEVRYGLSTPVTAGFAYVQLPDPHSGQKVLKEVMRSDGKRIKAQNAWLSKTREGSDPWQHFVNLFDVNTTDRYSVVFEDPAAQSDAPVLAFIADRSGAEGRQFFFVATASDPDGTIPRLSGGPLPALAAFIDQGDGTGMFDWTPAQGQSGRYEITFRASDGVLEDSQQVVLVVYAGNDTDGDGMSDDWEMDHFGSLVRDGSDDLDGDGMSDLDEFLGGTDPASGVAPSIPVILFPAIGGEVNALQPEVVIENSVDPDGETLTYEFEIYGDIHMVSPVAADLHVQECAGGEGETSWIVPGPLNDNGWYYLRVRATDRARFSDWAYGKFFVNTQNDPPGRFHASSPADNAEVAVWRPALEVTNSADPDGDELSYAFFVYEDGGMTTLVASSPGVDEGASGVLGATAWETGVPLANGGVYFWKAAVTDEHGAVAETPIASFAVNGSNAAPSEPGILEPPVGSEISDSELNLVIGSALDPNGDVLSCFFELDKVCTFDSGSKQSSGEVSDVLDTTSWHVSGLDDDTEFFWRAKSRDTDLAESPWALGSFFINRGNDSPELPTVKSPGNMAWAATTVPVLALNPSSDKDRDRLIYHFELFTDAALTNVIFQADGSIPEWVVPSELQDRAWFFWRAQVEDEHGAVSGWTPASSFFVADNGVEDPPSFSLVQPAEHVLSYGEAVILTWTDGDPDSNAGISLYRDTDNAGQDGTLIVDGIEEDPDGQADFYVWDVSAVPEGTYYVYGVIFDGTTHEASYSPATIEIDRPAQPAECDFDQDGDIDGADLATFARGGWQNGLTVRDFALHYGAMRGAGLGD